MTGYLTQYGYAFLFVVVLFESTGIPLPGESILVASGMLAGEGSLNIWAVLFAAFAGSIVGDNLGYLVGRHKAEGHQVVGHKYSTPTGNCFTVTWTS